MDTSDKDIIFDENGICMRCNEFQTRILPEWNYGKGHEKELSDLISKIKRSGETKEYDCLIGLSGGMDSSYMLHLAVREWGLRPFVFHIDAGWNLPVAEENIRKITSKLGVKLHVKKMDWEEMRQLQLAWFRTGVEDLDVPQDHAFIATVDEYAQKVGVKYILNGFNIVTESVADPASWSSDAGPKGDSTYLKDVIRKYCDIPIKKYSFTNGFKHKFVVPYIRGVKTVNPLNLVEFTKESMEKTLIKDYNYVPYEQKHFEDLLTKFLEGYWMPTRFGHDIRRVHLSSLVITGQMKREDALELLKKPPLSKTESEELFKEVAKKLQIEEDELMKYHDMPKCTKKFKSQEIVYKVGIRLYEQLGLEKRIRR